MYCVALQPASNSVYISLMLRVSVEVGAAAEDRGRGEPRRDSAGPAAP